MVNGRIKQSISIVKMRMIKWMREMTIENRIRNEYMRCSIGVVDKMRENKLRWFLHVMR
jgi:hypothetical protein